MNLWHILLVCILKLVLSEALKCGEVECPHGSSNCNVNYMKTSASKATIATVSCYDNGGNIIFKKTYDSITKQLVLPVPEVKCGGHLCQPGAYSCLSSTETSYSVHESKKVVHLTCYDGEGTILEKRDIVNPTVLPSLTNIPPPSCDGYLCPQGSGRCLSEVTLKLKPVYTVNTHITCFDFDNKVTADVRL